MFSSYRTSSQKTQKRLRFTDGFVKAEQLELELQTVIQKELELELPGYRL